MCLSTGFAPVTRDAIVDALGWHPAHPVTSDAEQAQGLDHGGVRPLPDDHGQFRCPEQAVGLHIPAGQAVTTSCRRAPTGDITGSATS